MGELLLDETRMPPLVEADQLGESPGVIPTSAVEEDLSILPEPDGLRQKVGRWAAKVAVIATAFGAAFGSAEVPAHADSGGQEYTVDATAAAGGVYARSAPDSDATKRISGYGVWPGDTVETICGVTNGSPVGERQNTTWHKIIDKNNPGEGVFWINDHYLDTPNAPGQLAPGEKNCDAPTTPQKQGSPEPWDVPTTSIHNRIDHVEWVDTAFGKSLHVYMTRSGYLTSFAFAKAAFGEVMHDAHIPYSASMYNQFACHAYIAPPWKASWNLDIWRPDVGLAKTIADRCNPQPGESS